MKFLQAIMSVTGLAPQLSNPTQPRLPLDHPASMQFSAWLNAFNTIDKATITAYHTNLSFPLSAWEGHLPSHDNTDRLLMFSEITGGFDVVKVESVDEPSFVVVVMKEKKGPRGPVQCFRGNMSVDISRPTYPATKFQLVPTVTPLDLIAKDDPRRAEYEKAMQPLTAVRRRAVIDGFLDVLKEQYVNPEVGEDIKAMLESNLENGEYDSIEDNEKFAHRLSHDLRSHEKHLFIAFFEPRPELNHSEAGPTPKKFLEELRLMNFGFGNTSFDTESGHMIATLPINNFIPIDERFEFDSEEIRAAVGDIMSSVADADALIVDLRNNHGGDPRTVSFVISYLLDNAPLHILDMVYRNGTVERSHSTFTIDELPAGAKRFGGTKPLFVLTTNHTISGGEDLAYSLQALKRAQAVIGEGNDATAGAANPIYHTHFVAEKVFGKGWWFVGIPSVKPVHAVTGSNWERVGVKSDIIAGQGEWVGEKNAEAVARELAMRALQRDEEL